MVGTSQFFIGGMKWQHAVILESIWETDSIIIHFPVLADGTPYSSSDLPYFTLLLYLDKNILSPHFLSLLFEQKKFSKSNFNSAKIFEDNFKLCLSQIPIASRQKILRQFQIMSLSIFSPVSLFCTLAIGL